MSQGTIAAAKIAAAKCAAINAKLAARGKTIETKLLLKVPTAPSGPIDPYSAEIMINDLTNRGLVLKSQVQEQISQWSGASLVTRGRYLTPTDKSRHLEKPLYIHISGNEVEGVKRAVHRVIATLNQTSIPNGSKYDGLIDQRLLRICERDAADSAMPFVEKVYCGRGDLLIPDDMKERCVGPEESYVKHITNQTCARLTLRGKGSGFIEPETGREAFEPLFFQINHSTLEGMVETKKLVDSLLHSVHIKIREQYMKQSSHACRDQQTATYQTGQTKPVQPTSYPTQQTSYPTSNPSPDRYSLAEYRKRKTPAGANHSSPTLSRDTNRPITASRFDIPASGVKQKPRKSRFQDIDAPCGNNVSRSNHGNQPRILSGHGNKPRIVAGHVFKPKELTESQDVRSNHYLHQSGNSDKKVGNSDKKVGNSDKKGGNSDKKVGNVEKTVKRRFTESYNQALSRQEEARKKMPPPLPKPTKPCTAVNVASWVKDAYDKQHDKPSVRSNRRESREYSLKMDYDDSSEED